jgi:competence protein ComEC
MAVVTGARFGLAIAAGVGFMAALVAWKRRWASAALVAVALISCAIIGGGRVLILTDGPAAHAAASSRAVSAEVTVTTLAPVGDRGSVRLDGTLRQFTLDGTTWSTRAPILAWLNASQAESWAAIPLGATVTITARLAPADVADGVVAELTGASAPVVVESPAAWQVVVERIRAGLREAMSLAPADQAALVPALVVGDTSLMPTTLKEQFRTTGLTHLTAVSGANLTIMLAFVTAMARAVGARGRGITLLAVATTVGFVALCHGEPSVVRAAAMGLAGLAALGRADPTASGLRALSVAIIALCWIDPWMSRSIGFALSVLACGGIILWARRWADRLERWLPGWLAEAIAVPLAAQLATQPVVTWLSGAISLSGLVANAAAGPWVGPTTVAGLATALVAVISPTVASLLGRVAGWGTAPIIAVAEYCSALAGASYEWPVTPIGLVLLALACLLTAQVVPHVLARPIAVVLATILMVAGMVSPPIQPGWPPRDWLIVTCDVGQGDMTVVNAGPGVAIVIDTGPPSSGAGRCLAGLGVAEIPVLVLTHPHADHTGGLDEVLAGAAVSTILVLEGAEQDSALQQARDRGVTIRPARVGASVVVGSARLDILAATPLHTSALSEDGESGAVNDASIVARIDIATTTAVGQISLLTTGDIEEPAQRSLVAQGDAIAVDVLKTPHHGSSGFDEGFLAATGASIALIGVGEGNDYGHPAAATLAALTRLGMTVARTDRHGSIAVAVDDDALVTVVQKVG